MDDMAPEGPAPVASDSVMLGGLPDEAVDAFLSEVGPGGSTALSTAGLRQLGGALGRPHPDGGALSHLDASFLAFGAARATTPESAAQGREDAAGLSAAMAPWSTGRTYLALTERPAVARTAYTDTAWRRLVRIRTATDPHGLLVANHPIPLPRGATAEQDAVQGVVSGVTTRLRPECLAR